MTSGRDQKPTHIDATINTCEALRDTARQPWAPPTTFDVRHLHQTPTWQLSPPPLPHTACMHYILSKLIGKSQDCSGLVHYTHINLATTVPR